MYISVITVNYNSSDLTLQFVDSIQRHTNNKIEYEIIIVDNDSSEEEKLKLAPLQEYKNIQLIFNRKNTGFAAGNMLGVQYSSADYYCFLNNDMKLKNDILEVFSTYALAHKECALLTGQLYLSNDTKTTSFNKFPTVKNKIFGNAIVRFFNKYDFPSNKTKLNSPTDVSVVSGSCMFFNAQTFDDIGGFDTLFFLYCEEEDISKRIWENGYKVRFLPDAKLIHYEGGSSSKNILLEKEYYISYFLLIDKHFGFLSSKVLKTLTIFKLFRRSFRSKHYMKLFLFVLKSAPVKESLRYKQSLHKKTILVAGK